MDSNNNVSPDTRTVYIAFALVFGAGMATAIGASVVIFLPKLVTNHTVMNRYVLASSLGISAGVMIYVSMIEIFQKSRIAFIDAGYAENIAYAYATACFFAGVCIMMLLNVLVTHFLHSHHHHHQTPELQQHVRQTHQRHQRRNPDPTTTTPATDADNPTATTPAWTTQTTTSTSVTQDLAQRLEHEPPSICCASEDPVRDLEVFHQMAEILVAEQEQRERQQQQQQQQQTIAHPKMTTLDENEPAHVHEKLNDETPIDGTKTNNNVILDDGAECNSAGSSHNDSIINQDDDDVNHHHDDNDRKLLLRMSMNTAIAIGLHNFPEGLATFVATLHDPQVGVILAIAIAIHNIPEGLCVALPVYYATGSRSKAFGWAILSGLSEPLAAIFGYIILANAVTGTIYGILFGIVAGMMVMISTRELLPTAHRYDPTDRVVTYSFIFGMGILALSLVLFVL